MRKTTFALFVLITSLVATSSCDDGHTPELDGGVAFYNNDSLPIYEDVELAIKIDSLPIWDISWINRYNEDTALVYTALAESSDSAWYFFIDDTDVKRRLSNYEDSAWLLIENKYNGQQISISPKPFNSAYDPLIREMKGSIVMVTEEDWD